MNWKRWVVISGALAILAMSIVPQQRFTLLGPRPAEATTYQLAVSSFVVYSVNVSTFVWTQVDVPQLVGRTALEIFNVDASSAVICRQDNLTTVVGIDNSKIVNYGNARPVQPTADWSLSISNFSSNRGAYPVSVSMPVYCLSTRLPGGGVTSSTVTVTQTY